MRAKDGYAALVMALIVLAYVLFLNGTDFLLVSSVRWTTVTILVLGAVGCGFGAANELYTGTKTAVTRAFVSVASVLGVTALVAAAIALIGASETMLATFFAATAALWLVATTRHLIGQAGKPTVEPRKEARTR